MGRCCRRWENRRQSRSDKMTPSERRTCFVVPISLGVVILEAKEGTGGYCTTNEPRARVTPMTLPNPYRDTLSTRFLL